RAHCHRPGSAGGLSAARPRRGNPLRARIGARHRGAARDSAFALGRGEPLGPRRQGPRHHSRSAQVSRLSEAFPKGRTALVCYAMGGDGDTAALLQAIDGAGADVIELGLPFSDPIADGPVLQAAATRALKGGTTLRGLLKMVSTLRLR